MQSKPTTPQPEARKAPYEKPAVVYRQVLESVAAACDTVANGKMTDDQCAVLNS